MFSHELRVPWEVPIAQHLANHKGKPLAGKKYDSHNYGNIASHSDRHRSCPSYNAFNVSDCMKKHDSEPRDVVFQPL